MSSIFGEPRGALRKGLVIRNGVIVTEAEAASAPAPVAAPAEIQAAVVKCGAGGPSAVSVPAPRVWVKSALSLEERFAVCRSVGEECIQEDELLATLRAKDHPVCYDGFEPSGRMHIAQGILKAINVNKLTSAGCVFKFWVADWFAMLNNKMDGDLKKIRLVGEYMIEVWKAAGMNMDNVEFLWASDEINKRAEEYWSKVMDIAMRFNLKRVLRCCTIMGRAESDEMSAAQIMYPVMQCTDIFFLQADICQLGMDQRKVNMLAREYCDECKPKKKFKPIILSHPMMMGLKEDQEKMSKSDPDSAIFMEDTAADVERKVKRAFCPIGVVEKNPCLNWTRHIIFGKFPTFTIERADQDGGNITYNSYAELEADFVAQKLHPKDLKAALARTINALLEPVRVHFASGRPKELLEKVKKFRTTR